MNSLIATLLFIPTAFAEVSAEPRSFPLAKKCGDSYWSSMRGVDICIGGRPRPECPPELKDDEMMWALPSTPDGLVVVKTTGEKIYTFAPQPAFKVDGACYKIISYSFFFDELKKTKCPKTAGPNNEIPPDEARVSADLLMRIATDIQGLANEFENHPPYDEVSEANNRYIKFLAFNPEPCRQALELLKSTKDVRLSTAIGALESQLNRWTVAKKSASTLEPIKDPDGAVKKRDGKN